MSRLPFAVYFIPIIIGAGICVYISVPCAVVLIVASIIILGIHAVEMLLRKKRVLEMCKEIDSILMDAERFRISDYSESELSLLEAEINKMTIKLREQNAKISETNLLLKESMEDISHQLRTPLTSMMLLVDMLHDPQLGSSERRQYINEIGQLNDHMKWLIETLLSLSRLEAGAVTFNKEHISCSELVRNTAERFMISAEVKGVEIITETEGEPYIDCDIRQTSEAIGNLLKNCIEHTDAGGTIKIHCYDNAIYSGIEISDTGCGFTEEEIPHVFERFYRNGEREKSGFGIGLAYSRKVIVSQNGSIQAKNTASHGALFDIRFYKTII